MNSLYELRTVRLIHWHNFVDETIGVQGNLFLVGDNGSGKTTLLDAVHCALTGDWKVELNAAARVGGRRHTGRDLAGIVLRHDVERGYQRPDGAVAYAALEFARVRGNGSEEVLSIGIGLFVASPESRPDKWGFIAAAPLSAIPLLVGDDPRPADRRELAAADGVKVLDIGRYRSQVGERLFGRRDHLEQTASFLQAGKAYRELVTKTANFSELFSRLLRAPDVESYQEARKALEAIERLRGDRDALGEELAALRRILGWREQVDQEREALARYEYLDRLYSARTLQQTESVRRKDRDERDQKLQQIRDEREKCAAGLKASSDERSRLRSSEDARLLERLQHEERSLREAKSEADADRTRRDEAAALFQRLHRSLNEHIESLGNEARIQAERLRPLRPVATRLLGEDDDAAGLEAAFLAVAEAPADARFDGNQAEENRRSATAALRTHRQDLDRRSRESALALEAARQEFEEAEQGLEALRNRGEIEPPVPGLEEARARLKQGGIEAMPFYRLVEPRRGVTLDQMGLLERTLGNQRLAALVTAPADHPRALALLLAHAPDVPLVQCSNETRPRRGRAWNSATGSDDDKRRPVLDDLRVVDKGGAATAFLREHLGGLVWAEPGQTEDSDADEEFLSTSGHLRSRRLDLRLRSGPARYLGSRARKAAFEQECDAWTTRANGAREGMRRHEQDRRSIDDDLRDTDAALDAVERLDLRVVDRGVLERDSLRERVAEDQLRVDEFTTRARRSEALHSELARSVEALRQSASEGRLDALAQRIAKLDAAIEDEEQRRRHLDQSFGECSSRLDEATRRYEETRIGRGESDHGLREAKRGLLARLSNPPADLDDYVLRIKRGQQIKRHNLPAKIEEAQRAEERALTSIASTEGTRHSHLWQKYAFRHEKATNRISDSSDIEIDAVTTRLQEQVDELDEVLGRKNQELLERIVLEDLVGTLRRDGTELRDTVRGVNRLIQDLRFGRTRYRIEAAFKPEYRKMNRLLESSSALSAASRSELRDYFASRLDDFHAAEEDSIPPFLDYRRWYDFRIHGSTLDDEGVELSRERLAQGSGGEQAVPNYLLLFCLTTLLYDGIGARVRLLLLDEAFYGIDAGRREELLRFCDRARISLVVATPEMDGVSDAMRSSTTLLIEKTAAHDVYLWDARFRRSEGGLFDRPEDETDRLALGAEHASRAQTAEERDDGAVR